MQQGEKKGIKSAILQMFKSLAIWATVCVVIPGLVIGFFPGTFLALLVPLACKLAWNAYSIVKLWKQFKKVKQEWGTYKTWQKWLNVIAMIATVIGICFNFKTLADYAGPVLEAFSKQGVDLMSQAKLGIEPDVLQKGFGALVKMLKEGKCSFDDLGKAYAEIGASFAKEVNMAETTTKVIKNAAKMGKSGKDVIEQHFNDQHFSSSHQAWVKGLHPNELNPDTVLKKIGDKDVADVVFDGVFSKQNAWSRNLISAAKECGYDEKTVASWFADKGFNSGLNHMCSNAGSVTGAHIPAKMIKYFLTNHTDLGHNSFEIGADGFMKGIAIMGTSGDIIQTTKIITTASDILTAMVITIPTVSIDVHNEGGFQVKLGGKKDKNNYIYEVDKDGIRKDDMSKQQEMLKEKNPAFIDVINAKFKNLKDTITKAKEEEKDEKKQKQLDKALNTIEAEIKKEKIIVYYGKQVKKEEKKNESLTGIYNYLLFEASDTKENIAQFFRQYLSRFTVLTTCNIKDEALKNELKEKLDAYRKHFEEKVLPLIDDKKFSFVKDDKNNVISIQILKDASDTDIKSLAKKISIVAHPDRNGDLDRLIEKVQKEYSGTGDAKDAVSKDGNVDLGKALDGPQQAKLLGLTDAPAVIDKSKGELVPVKTTALAVVPKKEDEPTKDGPTNETPEETDDLVPVLAWSPVFMIGADLAAADSSGKPRKEVYTMKGMYEYLTYSEIKGGISIKRLEDFFADELINYSIYATFTSVTEKPFDKDGNENKEANDETVQEYFGKFTKSELTEIHNDPKAVKKYLGSTGKTNTLAEDEEEKKQVEEDTKTAKEKLEKDEKLQKQVEDSETLSKKYKKGDDIDYGILSHDLAEFRLGQRKARKAKSKKGFFSKLVDKIKSFFGWGSADEEKEMNKLYKNVYDDIDESFEFMSSSLVNVINEHRYRSLSDYVMNK